MPLGDFIVNTLLESKGQTVSGEKLANRFKVTRTAVWKSVKSLQKEGYNITIEKRRGYRLNKLTKRPIEREIKRGLATERLGQKVHYFDTVDSTNNAAKELARTGALEGTVVVALTQTMGRGRHNRIWESPKGGVYMSVVLRPGLHPKDLTRLTLLSGLAVATALNSLYDIKVRLKWPNDLMLNSRKLGGILSEMEGEAQKVNFVIVGIGLNANTDIKVDIPTATVKKVIEKEVDLVLIIKEVLKYLERLYDEFLKNPTGFLKEYREISHTLRRDVEISLETEVIRGNAVDIDSDGALELRLPDGSYTKILSGDCRYLKSRV